MADERDQRRGQTRNDPADQVGRKGTDWSRMGARSRPGVPIAIALNAQGDAGKDGGRPRSPKVVATGRGAVAEQILAIAFEKGVPVREDADLAQILAAVELDAEIPIDALAAVAEILSYVYRTNRSWTGESDTGQEPN